MRADLYAALAEALAEPPAWLAAEGRAWPLTAAVGRLAAASAAARRALAALAGIPAEPPAARRARYARLFEGRNAAPRFWLYESAAATGRILGPQTAAVAALYRAAGVAPALGAELPDHAALELAFLAHLAEQAAADPAQAAGWRAAERQFLKEHGDWLIELGRGLAADGDAVYAPIGALLADWLSENLTPGPSPARRGKDLTSGPSPARRGEDLTPGPSPARRGEKLLPVVARAEACTLCSFCVQVCPTRALRVDEDARETRLVLDPAACTGCGKCVRTCDPRAITLAALADAAHHAPHTTQYAVHNTQYVLRCSPRASCPACGAPTVSRAELAFVAARLGDHPSWLDYCLACRPEYAGG